jgi:hypothetical protein
MMDINGCITIGRYSFPMFIFGTRTIVFERLIEISDRRITLTATLICYMSEEEIVAPFAETQAPSSLTSSCTIPPHSCWGVSPEAAEALKKLGGVESVLDLATSIVFDAPERSSWRQGIQAAPSSAVTRFPRTWFGMPLAKTPSQPIKLLFSVPGG